MTLYDYESELGCLQLLKSIVLGNIAHICNYSMFTNGLGSTYPLYGKYLSLVISAILLKV